MKRADLPENETTASKRRWWLALNATVFVAAACIMTVEILSTRLVARFLGSSLYTWTAAIGVVLAGISIGNYVGGRLADRCEPRRTLSRLFIASSIACATIPAVNGWLGTWTALDGLSWPTRIFLHFALTFLLPATMLGTMSPVVAKMALELGLGSGRTIGTIYAWGSVGSIAGTFVAGFWLVARIGTERSILVIAGTLAIVGILYAVRTRLPYVWSGTYGLMLFCGLGPLPWSEAAGRMFGLRDASSVAPVFLVDSRYQRVAVFDDGGGKRTMLLDALTHSRIDLENPLALKYEYEAIYASVLRAADPGNAPVTAHFIGGGGYVFPRYLELVRPGSTIEVAEIDPIVERAAYEAFGLPRDTHVQSYTMDARNRLSDLLADKRAGEPVPEFDYVFGDAFNDLSVPFHLTTLEFDTMIAELLGERGVYLLNVIDVQASGRFLGAAVHTCRQVFAHVYVFSADGPAEDRNTFVLVGSKRELDLSHVVADAQRQHGIRCKQLPADEVQRLVEHAGHLVLTDDYAPVENLLIPAVKSRGRASSRESELTLELQQLFDAERWTELAQRCDLLLAKAPRAVRLHHWRGTALRRLDRIDEAIADFRAEIAIDPTYDRAHYALANALTDRGDREGALLAWQAATVALPSSPDARRALAAALNDVGRRQEAEQEYRAAIAAHPGYVPARLALAEMLVSDGKLPAAVFELEEAVRIAPMVADARQHLGLALFMSQRHAEAARQFRAAVELAPDNGSLQNQFGRVLTAAGDFDGAVAAFTRAVELAPQDVSYCGNLGLALQQSGRAREAAARYRACLELEPRQPPMLNALARLLATSTDDAVRDGPEAVRRAEALLELVERDNPEALGTLAAALAESGRFAEAVTTAETALKRAEATKMDQLAASLQRDLAAYRAGKPVRE